MCVGNVRGHGALNGVGICVFFYVPTKRSCVVHISHIYSIAVVALWYFFFIHSHVRYIYMVRSHMYIVGGRLCFSGWKRLFMRKQSGFNMSVKWDYTHLSKQFSMFCVHFRCYMFVFIFVFIIVCIVLPLCELHPMLYVHILLDLFCIRVYLCCLVVYMCPVACNRNRCITLNSHQYNIRVYPSFHFHQ